MGHTCDSDGLQRANIRPQEPDGPGGPTDLRLWVRLLVCARVIEKRLRRNFQEQFDTTLPRFDVLAALARSPQGLSMSALSRACLVSNGNVTAIVRQLRDSGHVTLRADRDDRRSAVASLSRDGCRHFAQLAQAHRGWVLDALKDMPQPRQTLLLDLLAELKSSLD